RVNATINNAGLLTQYKYNEHGQLAQTIAFDEKAPENKQHQHFSYDDAGRLISSQNSKGDTTEQHFEGLSQPHCVIQPDGSALHLTYDKERNLTAIERSDGHIYRISYDANENPTQVTGFDGTLQQYKYDACNRLTSVTQSDKRHVKIERDKLGRVIAQHASLATDTHIVNNANYYNYNLQGKITRAHNAQSTLKQQFDKGGRLLRAEQVHNQQQAHTLKYSYDDYGRRQSLTLPDSSTLKYSYNKFGQLSAIHLHQANSTAVELAALSYDSQGNIQTQKFGNDIALTQQFDVFNRLTQQQLTHPAQALFDTCKYNYDSVNQLIARKEQGVSSHNINFEYNSLGQLIQQNLVSSENTKTTQYQWDSFGNPVSQSKIQNNELSEQQATQHNDDNDAINKVESNQSESTRNVIHSEYSDSSTATAASELSEDDGVITGITDADRLTHFGDSDFHYDEFGNQIRETGKGIKTRREYNAFNQLSCFNNNGTLTQYDYDPLGRRIAKHTEHGKIDYIWDNDQLIGEYQHGEYTWYINLPNQFHPVALIKQGEVYYYHLDQLNTPRFVTNSKAEVVWENQADVYGYEESEAEPESNKKDTFTQPIRFQGQYLDEESGLHYNRYRYYSPKQQRFINQDPIGLVGGINHYQYVPNPVNWVDPMGLLCKEGQAKVKAALDANSAISPELKEKLIKLSQLPEDASPYTADEMVNHINQNTADDMVNLQDKSALGSDNLTKKQREHFRAAIDTPQDTADDARFKRNVVSRHNRELPPKTRGDWSKSNETAKKNRALGQQNEKAAREALSKHKGESLVDNNNAVASGGKVQQRSGNSLDYKTRPDSLGDTIVHEHKHFTAENSNPVVYNTKQLEEQRKAFPDKDHVLTISSDLPCDNGIPPCQPSSKIKRKSEVLYFDNDKKTITHKWNVKKQRWNKVKG
ncbi:MAG: RHS repeat-associated core domain-containing protein, partial [Pseudomonadota bacterium]